MDTEVFPPQQGEELRELTRQRPDLHGFTRSRWRLTDLRNALGWLSSYSLPGVSQALQRLGVKRKQGRLYQHSPDPHYLSKMRWIVRARQQAKEHSDKVSLLYADELSFYRQPQTAGGGVYHPKGDEPLFASSTGYNTRHRVGAAMDMHTGKVVWVDGAVVGVDALCLLLEKVRAAYGKERTIFLVWDNWPVHCQVDVLAKASECNIYLLWLPTYAPWTNPIEKLWRWLKQEHLRNHHLATRFDTLKERVRAFLDRFTHGSNQLLRYVGLLHDVPITRLTC